MLGRFIATLAVLTGCTHEQAQEAAHSRESCFGDQLPTLHGWKPRRDCVDDTARCRAECAAGDRDACFGVADVLQRSSELDAQPSPEVTSYFERACKLGSATGCTNWAAIGLFATHRTIPLICLYRVFDKTCEVGDPYGCTMTARMLVEWNRTAVDKWIGYNQLVNACDKHKGPPCRFLALYIERGEFETPDRARIRSLLARACDGNDPQACGDRATVEETLLPAIKGE